MQDKELTWPEEPYKGLAYYGPDDGLLFSGREADVDDCVVFLAHPATRMLLLYGRTACGKSSFLRAGLIPALESRGFAYQFLRDDAGAVTFIRASADPIARIAEEVYAFASRPHVERTAKGKKTVDLSAVRLGHQSVHDFVLDCRKPGRLLDALSKLCELTLHTLVIILDQAEEVITLTSPLDPERLRFFEFLQKFNASTLNVKFVIALRRDDSMEFFALIQLDNSLKTDIKQFMLQNLGPEDVLRAIELPTNREKRGALSAHEKYQFEFEPGLAARIRDELFETSPSGGILPVMQIVCRDLFNEVSTKPPPHVIDATLYEAGKRITGRVDRHVTKVLLLAFREHGQPIEVEAEEQAWRGVLFNLVRRETDGTVRTDMVPEGRVIELARAASVKTDPAAVLGVVSRTENLVLRKGLIRSGETQREHEVVYRLGHDAIGLALTEWKARADEAAKRVAAETRFRRRVRQWTAVGLAAAVVLAFAVYQAVTKDNLNKKAKFDALTAAAARLVPTNPRVAAAAAVEAIKYSELNDHFWSSTLDTTSTRLTLATVLVSEPLVVAKQTLPRPLRFVRFSQRDELINLPSIDAFFKIENDLSISMYRAKDGVKQTISSKDIRMVGKLDDAEVSGSAPDTALVLLTVDGDEHAPRVVVIQGNRVQATYSTDDLLRLSKQIRVQLAAHRRDRPILIPSGDTIHLTTSRLDDDSAEILKWVQEGTGGHFIRIGYYENRSTQSRTKLNYRNIVLTVATQPRDQAPLSSDLQNRGDLAAASVNITATDVAKGTPVWTFKTLRSAVLDSCRMTPRCIVRPIGDWGNRLNLPLIALLVDPEGAPLPQSAAATPRKNSDHLADASDRRAVVVADITNGQTWEIKVADMRRFQGPREKTPSPETQSTSNVWSRLVGEDETPVNVRDDRSVGPFALAATDKELFIAWPAEMTIDIFNVHDSQLSFAGRMLQAGPSRGRTVGIDPRNRRLMVVSTEAALSWDLATTVKARRDELLRNKSDLIQLACRDHLLGDGIDGKMWFLETGLTDPPPVNPCSTTTFK